MDSEAREKSKRCAYKKSPSRGGALQTGCRFKLGFDFDFGAGSFEFFLDVFGFVFFDAFFDGRGSAVDEGFGFFEAETRDAADFFDDVDFVGTDISEDDFEFRRFFSCGGSCGNDNTTAASGFDIPFLLEFFDEVVELDDCEGFKILDDLFFCNHG